MCLVEVSRHIITLSLLVARPHPEDFEGAKVLFNLGYMVQDEGILTFS